MATTGLRIGIVGCGRAARVHLRRLLDVDGVRVVGCADLNPEAAGALAGSIPPDKAEDGPVPTFADHVELIRQATPDAVAIFTPHLAHYRPAMDALQAGCHVFVEKPLSTNAQEAADIAKLARGRGLRVGVGHQYRLAPSLVEARRRVEAGVIGPLRLVVATLAQPWLVDHRGPADSWRSDPKVAGGGILTDTGDHLLDALLWVAGHPAVEVAAFQARLDSGLDVVTAAAIRLADGTPVALGLSGVSPGRLFELTLHGEAGRIRVTEADLIEEPGGEPGRTIPLPEPLETIDGNFVTALRDGGSPCCSADDAVDTVRLLEAIARSATSGQVVRLA